MEQLFMDKIEKNILKNYKFWLAVISVIFYGFFAFFDGPHISPDSETYINMDISREPVYPISLAMVRGVFGEGYLMAVVILQSLLAAYAAYKITVTFQEIFELKYFLYVPILLLQYAISMLNRFIALRGAAYSNCIQTEGISVSLWTLWVCCLIQIVCKKSRKNLMAAFGLALLLMCTRKQLLLTIPVLFVVLICVYCIPKWSWKRALWIVCAVIGLFLAQNAVGKVYNYVLRGDFVGYTDSSNTFFTNMMFASDREDAQLIQDEELREVFLTLYDALDSQKLNYKYAEDGLLNLESYYSDCYDEIGIRNTQPMLLEYAQSEGITDSVAKSMEADRIRTTILKDVLKDNIPIMFRVYVGTCIKGFIQTIAKVHPLLNLYSALAYLAYLIMLVYLLVRKRLDKVVKIALLTGLLVCANVFVTALVISSQTRYMIYNMALCYMVAYLMVLEVFATLPEKLMQFVKFAMVGCFNFGLSYVIIVGADLIGLGYQTGNILAYIITVFSAYLINGHLVFKKQEGEERGFLKPLLKVYASYLFTSLILNAVLLQIQIELLHIPVAIAPVINLFITTPINFLLNKLWAFKGKSR